MTLSTPTRFLAVALLLCCGSLLLVGCDKPNGSSEERATAEPRDRPADEGDEKTEPQEGDTKPTSTPEQPKPPPEKEPEPPPPPESRWDPPTDIPHLESTPPDQRAKIDKLIEQMFDPSAGRDSLDAKEMLIVIGKPAFPRVLGRMAKARDEITDVDSHEERLLESSLKLADEALRAMDGWLTMKEKPVLRPGSKKGYIHYICRIHYKRWQQKLKYLDRMPGPYDPSEQYEEK
jgi:hypothetical protein